MMTKNMKNAKELNEFFGPVFTGKTCLQKSQVLGPGKFLSKEDFPLIEVDQVREYLNKLCIQKSMGPDGMDL